VDLDAIRLAVRLLKGAIQNRLTPEVLRETARLAEEELRRTTVWEDGQRPPPPERLTEQGTLMLHGEHLEQLLAGLDSPEAVRTLPLVLREALARVRRLLPEYVWTGRADVRGELLRAFEGVLGHPPTRPVIICLGDRCYQLDGGEPVSVSQAEDSVLRAFLRTPAMGQKQLIGTSGYEHAVRILRNLVKKYNGALAPAIRLPGKKSASGYYVSIREP
jgi:hypothetical protein